MKKVAIIQSNYIPWKGYFDIIASVDEFVIYDEVQYTRRDWRNRNRIKTPNGLKWLTVPVKVKGQYLQKIMDTEIDGNKWPEAHWNTLRHFYKNTPWFHEVAGFLEPVYMEGSHTKLSTLNRELIERICHYLGINTVITNSWDYPSQGVKTERLINICLLSGANEYITGPSARDYLDETAFAKNDIAVSWFEYDNYAEYAQPWGNFEHQVSIVDLLFNCGPTSPEFMKYVTK